MLKTFVLRTHALLSSRKSTLRFGEDNEVIIPLAVIDELRRTKQESFEKGKIARDLLEYINSFPVDQITSKNGVVQENGSILRIVSNLKNTKISIEGLTIEERRTLQSCLRLMKEEGKNVILVSNNLNLQIKAKILGIASESFKDETFPRLSEQYTGRESIFTTDDVIEKLYSQGYIEFKEIFANSDIEFVKNKFFIINSESKKALGKVKNGRIVKLVHQNNYPYGVIPKNVGQKFMIEALLDEECPLVVIKGNAGTGKTFCALAAGLEETEVNQKYSRILVTRSVTATEQYGFLPGDIEEKLSPYLAGIKDNLSILLHGAHRKKIADKSSFEDGTSYFERGVVQIQAIGFLRGRSIVDTYFIIDETQNIEPDTIKSIVTRAGEGSKFIFLGDPTQIDNSNLTERYNGLVYLSEKMKGNSMCAQITLTDNESVRSNLAREAAKIL